MIEKEKKWQVNLEVNGCKIPLNRFARSIIAAAVRGMVSSLKGVEKPEEITLKISEEDEE